jgi:membrane protein implicated in regulation of membrane protease activity
MMIKYLKISGIAYLLLAAFSIYKSISQWNDDRDKAYIFLGFAVVLVLLYFFKRNFIKRYQQRSKDSENNQ